MVSFPPPSPLQGSFTIPQGTQQPPHIYQKGIPRHTLDSEGQGIHRTTMHI